MGLYKVKADANQPEMQYLTDKQVAVLRSTKEMIRQRLKVSLTNKEIKLLREIMGVTADTKLDRLAELFICQTLEKYSNGKR
tara:strand:- start:3094 stop:3339 length:246 start_codon:yes stop_codon:yes gene_type:complete